LPRVELEADTIEELVDMVRRWVAGYPEEGADQSTDQELPPETLESVLERIKSPASRLFLREVAARTLAGETLRIDDALRARCGVLPGRPFVGVLGVANRTMRRRASRDLVTWDPVGEGYQVSFDDALVIARTLGGPTRDAA